LSPSSLVEPTKLVAGKADKTLGFPWSGSSIKEVAKEFQKVTRN
jgi:hypothetical protein